MKYSNSDPSPAYVLDTTHTPALFSSSMLQDAFSDEPGTVSSLKASKFLQILRKWGAQSRKPATAGAVVLSQRSTARSFSCSRLNLVPLRCLSMQLHSDDEDEEENGATIHNPYTPNRSKGSPRFISQSVPARALSCPKLSSPLSSCTPFSNINFDDQRIRDEEELECLNPSSVRNEESKGSTTSKGSSPLKLNLSRQPSTPKGYLALYVGEEKKRFVVKANLVNHPLFGVLLEKAKEEFGFEQQGALNIPCEIAFFQHIMLLVESNDPFYRNADQSTILLHLNNNMASTVA